ncbi:MAG: hypothetical protein HDS35_11300 [Bacteroides sp.]|nr:hypothetical protein [Bacteroides sp.]
MFRSKAGVIVALVIVVALIIVTAVFHAPWWVYIGEFFIYMSVFSNLIALLVERQAPHAARLLTKCAYLFAGLFFICIVVMFILTLTVFR